MCMLQAILGKHHYTWKSCVSILATDLGKMQTYIVTVNGSPLKGEWQLITLSTVGIIFLLEVGSLLWMQQFYRGSIMLSR